MKSALILLISSFFLIGVFGESLSVMEGSSVTLHTDLTEIQRTDSVEWRFNGSRIAKISWNSIGTISVWVSTDGQFRDRLQPDNQTGDLKITAFSNTDSGQYTLKIRSTRGSSEKTFNVNVYADKDPVKKVPGTVGGFVTLKPEKKSDEVIQWRFGPQNTLIAKVGVLATDYLDEKFRDRLKLDDDTGSLTITDIRTTDSGEYEAEIRGSRHTILKTFSVTVTETVDLVLLMEGDSVTLHTGVTKIPRDDAVLWFGDKGARITPLTGPVYPRWSNTEQNDQTDDLTIRNIRRDQSGDYKVIFMNVSGESKHRKFHLNIIGVNADPVKKVLGTVGESVTLKTEKQSDEVMKWRFGPQNTLIAELKKTADSFTVYDDVLDGRFRNRLKLDDDTGSLTITNTRTEHDGVYEAEIRGSGHTIHETFNVTVTDVKSMLVKEGDSVTLYTNLTQIQRNDVILWRFGDQDIIIARLNGTDVESGWSNVHLNYQTGDLNISNIRRDQFGDYKVEINTIFMISHRKYNISERVTVLVMEGDSVTLHTTSEIPRDNAVKWFGDKSARISPLTGSVDPRWNNTEQNGQTGDLSIKNIRRDQSGDYKVIFMNRQMLFVSMHRKFHINITDVFSDEKGGVKTVSVRKGDSVFLNTSVTEIQKGDLIEWLFGPQNITIAKTDGKNNSIYNDKDVRFKDRLHLDIQTGDLTIKNSNSEHSGHYQLKIINNSTYTIQKSFSVTVGLSLGAIAGIVVVVVAVLLVFAAVGVIYRYYRSSKTETHSEVNGQNHTSNRDEETELNRSAEAAE